MKNAATITTTNSKGTFFQLGNSASRAIVALEGTSVELELQRGDHALSRFMTPADARKLATALLNAANEAEANA